jgi:hypothetical protein
VDDQRRWRLDQRARRRRSKCSGACHCPGGVCCWWHSQPGQHRFLCRHWHRAAGDYAPCRGCSLHSLHQQLCTSWPRPRSAPTPTPTAFQTSASRSAPHVTSLLQMARRPSRHPCMLVQSLWLQPVQGGVVGCLCVCSDRGWPVMRLTTRSSEEGLCMRAKIIRLCTPSRVALMLVGGGVGSGCPAEACNASQGEVGGPPLCFHQ